MSRQAAKLARPAKFALATSPPGLRLARLGHVQHREIIASPRLFSTTPKNGLRDFFPAKDTPHIQTTKAAWPHPGYTLEEMVAVEPAHREPRNVSDWAAWKIVRFARYWMDKATGMARDQQVDKKHPTTSVVAEKPLTEAQWSQPAANAPITQLVRFVFLESIAGVPGMVGGMLRHLSSLRRMKRDNGWIETLLEESYNERMHLLTFMKMCEPGRFMKLMIIGAQGVFFNALFITYLLHPRIVHRFVGYLEEEAVHTYTRAIREIEHGHLPKWADPKFQIPDIAIQYWNMPEGNRTMKDLILYIRADEAGHRGVNHTLGNLNQKEDPNPFVSTFKDREPPRPALRAAGYERSDVI
ncbi:Alternative oxidase [Metarhizium album ARSEF 1941]|uniref:Alternative oxidase n=1 Tax=Metarhizium album (strain ARSEF 1941) TaxID=1081103 RepID=A0A0B2WYR4_METAS|nr:Alternative oxidase [Metarhizium album ARSEF 1941]KHN98567.1 Alternative oxidase [Metarhizium album ARSEF 1941]